MNNETLSREAKALIKVGEMARNLNIACDALREIASMDTSQDASPQQCGAVLIAMDALEEIK